MTEKALRAGPEWASSRATPRFTLLVFAPIAAWLFAFVCVGFISKTKACVPPREPSLPGSLDVTGTCYT